MKDVRRPSSRTCQRAEEWLRVLLLKHRPELAYSVGVDIVFHRNRSTMISWSRRGSTGTLRLHEIFASATAPVLEMIIRYFFTKPEPRDLRDIRSRIMDYVDENRVSTLADGGFPEVLPPDGGVYDLDDILDGITERFVQERRPPERHLIMGWSCKTTPSLMGKWIEGPKHSPNLIVINRLLDHSEVPRYYLEYIVYHETLHDLFPIRRRDGRWIHHSAEFRRRERRYPMYDEARSWEQGSLTRLLEIRAREESFQDVSDDGALQ